MSDEKGLSVHTPTGLLAPIASLAELKAAYQAKKEFIDSVLVSGVDYGVIPGTGTKPTLLKAGAEKISTLYGLQTQFELLESVLDWSGSDHDGEAFFYFHYKCYLSKGDVVMADAEGSANSWEKKYRYRTADLVCPDCGAAKIFRSKYPDDVTGLKGWFCWGAKGGCGANFDQDHPGIINQDRGQVPNPNPADVVNTLQKMSQKRAMVAAALIVGDVSDFFTQDLEDLDYGSATVVDAVVEDVTPAPAKKKATKKKATKKPNIEDLNPIFDAVVAASLAENVHSARNALNLCSTGYATEVAALSWMRFYRGWRDTGLSPKAASDKANSGEVPK